MSMSKDRIVELREDSKHPPSHDNETVWAEVVSECLDEIERLQKPRINTRTPQEIVNTILTLWNARINSHEGNAVALEACSEVIRKEYL